MPRLTIPTKVQSRVRIIPTRVRNKHRHKHAKYLQDHNTSATQVTLATSLEHVWFLFSAYLDVDDLYCLSQIDKKFFACAKQILDDLKLARAHRYLDTLSVPLFMTARRHGLWNDGLGSLRFAVQYNQCAVVEHILQTKHHPPALTTVFSIAAANHCTPNMKLLLAAGADINRALGDATAYGNSEIVSQLLVNGACVHTQEDYPLRCASAKGHLQIIAMLLKAGADVHAQTDMALRWASEVGHEKVVELLLHEGADVHAENNISLCLAVENGHLEVVRLLIKAKANIGARDHYALRWAAVRGHVQITAILLEAGADVHAQTDLALQWASEYGHEKVVELLLMEGADVHAKNNYALRMAASCGHLQVVRLLIAANANISAADHDALRLAASNGHVETVKFLITSGTSTHHLSKYALYWLKNNCTSYMLEVIQMSQDIALLH